MILHNVVPPPRGVALGDPRGLQGARDRPDPRDVRGARGIHGIHGIRGLYRRRGCALAGLLACAVLAGGCKPNPPPDVLRTQREALDKAKAVEGVLRQADDSQRKSIDDASK